MTYVTPEIVADAELEFGRPLELSITIATAEKELNRIRASQRDGRAHDVTIMIRREGMYLFIAKHFYPRSLYRAPSGAARRGETLAEAAKREAFEETGALIKPSRYVLRTRCRFQAADDYIDWTSHVFSADYVSGEIAPKDLREIRDARFVTPAEISVFNAILLKINTAGFRYREFITRSYFETITRFSPSGENENTE